MDYGIALEEVQRIANRELAHVANQRGMNLHARGYPTTATPHTGGGELRFEIVEPQPADSILALDLVERLKSVTTPLGLTITDVEHDSTGAYAELVVRFTYT